MKPEDLFDAIGMAEDAMVEKAHRAKRKKLYQRTSFFYGVVAAVLVVALGIGILAKGIPGKPSKNAYAIAEAVYPTMNKMPYEDDYMEDDNWDAFYVADDIWQADKEKQRAYYDKTIDLTSFFETSMAEFLSGREGENTVYSPLNLYMALAMLAETTNGESREQILSLLDVPSIEQLRKDVVSVWNSNYSDDGQVTSILANSLWLNENLKYKKEALTELAKTYYASSFCGNPEEEAYSQALRDWLNEQTGGLLEDAVKGVALDPSTIIALASTIYFKARWTDEFSTARTEPDIFYGETELTCDFMNRSDSGTYYWGEQFSAVNKGFHAYRGNCKMTFVLPDEGVTPENLLSDPEVMDFLFGTNTWEKCKHLTINLSVPKFDVNSSMDLAGGLQNLGVTDVFSPAEADFSAITDAPAYVTGATHSARVMIDEEGCTAAAFTLMLCGSGMPPEDEVDFVLNRPFLFMITSETGLPLFIGIVNSPT